MTKFTTLQPKKEEKKTKLFKAVLGGQVTITKDTPEDYDNILYLGKGSEYGDVFKAWNNNSDNFILFFGEKGSEFN